MELAPRSAGDIHRKATDSSGGSFGRHGVSPLIVTVAESSKVRGVDTRRRPGS